MKNLLIGTLAVAAGIYIEKKYHVCDKVAGQIKKYTGKNPFEEADEKPDLDMLQQEGGAQ